jgi:hypothetical protein
MPDEITLDAQIAEVHRELALRTQIYPSLVVRRKMRKSEADFFLDRMRAVLATLERLARERTHVDAKPPPRQAR